MNLLIKHYNGDPDFRDELSELADQHEEIVRVRVSSGYEWRALSMKLQAEVGRSDKRARHDLLITSVHGFAERWGMGDWGEELVHRALDNRLIAEQTDNFRVRPVMLPRTSIWGKPEFQIVVQVRFSVTSRRSAAAAERALISDARRRRDAYLRSFGFRHYLDNDERLKRHVEWLYLHAAMRFGWAEISAAHEETYKQPVGETTVRRAVIPLYELVYRRRPKLRRGPIPQEAA